MICLLLALTACFGQGNYLPDTNVAPGIGVKRIGGTNAMLRADWERSPWYRSDDVVVGVVFFVVADDGTACVVPDKLWVIVKAGDRIQCAPWRMPR